MSLPTIPNITPKIEISRDDSINLLLASIAFEELGLAHIINSEAEKIQLVLGTLDCRKFQAHTTGELIEINRSVEQMLKTIIKKEMLLQFKLEDILNIIRKPVTCSKPTPVKPGTPCHHSQPPCTYKGMAVL